LALEDIEQTIAKVEAVKEKTQAAAKKPLPFGDRLFSRS